MAYTLATAVQFLTDRNLEDTSARAGRDYVRCANDALSMIYSGRKWTHARLAGNAVFRAPLVTTGAAVSVNVAAAGLKKVVCNAALFTALHVGCHILFGDERRPYLIASVEDSTHLTLSENYHGATDATAVSFQIIQLRSALPADFLELEKPTQGTFLWYLSPIVDFGEYMQQLRYSTFVGASQWYCITREGDQAYLWMYPAPSAYSEFTFVYYKFFSQLADNADDFHLPLSASSNSVIEGYLLAALYKYQNKLDQFQAALGLAERACNSLMGELRPFGELPSGREPYAGGGAFNRSIRLRTASTQVFP